MIFVNLDGEIPNRAIKVHKYITKYFCSIANTKI